MRAPVQHTLWGAFDEEFGPGAQFGRFQGRTVRGHRFTVAREFQGEFLLPFRLYVLSYSDGRVTPVQPALRDTVRIDFLRENDEGSLGCLADFLECLFEFVEVDGGIVTHDTDSADLVERFVVLAANLLASQKYFTDRFVGGAGDLELVEAAVVPLDLVEDEHTVVTIVRKLMSSKKGRTLRDQVSIFDSPTDRHLIGSQCTSLVRAYDGGAAKGLDGWQ